MKFATVLGFGVALTLSEVSGASADCTYNEAEKLNTTITSRGVIIDSGAHGWTEEMNDKLGMIKSELKEVSERHSAAVSSDDQEALNAVCDDYRTIIMEIDQLTEKLE